jgi:hypothetical protein
MILSTSIVLSGGGGGGGGINIPHTQKHFREGSNLPSLLPTVSPLTFFGRDIIAGPCGFLKVEKAFQI